jgi:hypothetical protein
MLTLMRGGRSPVDVDGWAVPRMGSLAREVYEYAKQGVRSAEIAVRVDRPVEQVASMIANMKAQGATNKAFFDDLLRSVPSRAVPAAAQAKLARGATERRALEAASRIREYWIDHGYPKIEAVVVHEGNGVYGLRTNIGPLGFPPK